MYITGVVLLPARKRVRRRRGARRVRRRRRGRRRALLEVVPEALGVAVRAQAPSPGRARPFLRGALALLFVEAVGVAGGEEGDVGVRGRGHGRAEGSREGSRGARRGGGDMYEEDKG